MTAAADLLLTNAEVHTLAGPDDARDPDPVDGSDAVHEAVAVRAGRVVGVGAAFDLGFLADVETRVIDLDDRVLLPGFVDAHTHLLEFGLRLENADLGGVQSVDAALERLRDAATGGTRSTGGTGDEWTLGFGLEDDDWARPLRRTDLGPIGEGPVAVFREDLHGAVLDPTALDRLRGALDAADVEVADGEPTGVVVEDAVGVVRDAIAPDRAGARELLLAVQSVAHERGVTGVHEMVPGPAATTAYRDLDLADDLRLRVRLYHGADRLDALASTGQITNHGSAFVEVGGIKLFADGSLGSHTARLREPYADRDGAGDDEARGDSADAESGADRGRWATPPDELAAAVQRANDAGFQVAVHAIGDAAIDATLDALEGLSDAAAARHRIEHAELADDEHYRRMADAGVIASVQPNFHRWAGADGLYERRLGAERGRRTNRLARLRDAGVDLVFGSDCVPLAPLAGVHRAVNAPTAAQRLDVTDALRAYTVGSATAAFGERDRGPIERGRRADLVALERSPWERPGAIDEIDVALTVVDGQVVFDGR